jgi:hypothetical protein
MRKSYAILIRKYEGERPFGRPRNKWEDNITMPVKEEDVKLWNGFNWLSIGSSGQL